MFGQIDSDEEVVKLVCFSPVSGSTTNHTSCFFPLCVDKTHTGAHTQNKKVASINVSYVKYLYINKHLPLLLCRFHTHSPSPHTHTHTLSHLYIVYHQSSCRGLTAPALGWWMAVSADASNSGVIQWKDTQKHPDTQTTFFTISPSLCLPPRIYKLPSLGSGRKPGLQKTNLIIRTLITIECVCVRVWVLFPLQIPVLLWH